MKKNILIFIIMLRCLEVAYTQESTYQIKNLEINTKESDFGVTFYKKNKVVFTSPKKQSFFIKRKWKPNNQGYLDFYESTIDRESNELTDKIPFSKEINTRLHEGTLAFTKDYQTVYFTRDNYLDEKVGKSDAEGKIVLKLYKATVTNGKWGNIVELPFNSHNYSVGHPSLSKDDKQLYFVSNMPESMGETDVFVVDVLGDNEYSTPRNLGATINTVGKEMFPFIDEDGVLYFSSNGRADGLGGLDIYYSKKQYDNTYTTPKNLGSSINSISDDFCFVKKEGENIGYFASNRYGGKGDDDIYSFIGTLKQRECENIIEGITLEKSTGIIIQNATINIYDSNNNLLFKTISDNGGRFSYPFKKCNASFKVEVLKNNYIKVTEEIKVKDNLKVTPLTILLENIIAKEKFVNYDEKGRLLIEIEDIYYDFNKSNIRYSERPKMNRLIELMNKYPEISILIESHTDCRGTEDYNMNLSNQRAKKVKDYIISRGVSSGRIECKGYGESRLINNCSEEEKKCICNETQHLLNRRTEFIIKD